MNEIAGISTKEALGFTVVAAVITTFGTLVGLVLKELFLARSFEEWKARRTLQGIYRKYRDPIVLASVELADRLDEVARDYPTEFLDSKLLAQSPPPPNRSSEVDPYYRRYKCQSSIYRLCALLGWLELHRQDIVFLTSGKERLDKRIGEALTRVRSVMADGHLNDSDDWETWTDALIFREEQRAIGECMVAEGDNGRVVLGYGQFVAALEDTTNPRNRWLRVAANFLLDPHPPKDFRLRRYRWLVVHLVDLIETLEPARLGTRQIDARERWRQPLTPAAA
jgi:hypothetical protein